MYKKYQNRPSQQGLCGEKILNWLDVYMKESLQIITELSYWWNTEHNVTQNNAIEWVID